MSHQILDFYKCSQFSCFCLAVCMTVWPETSSTLQLFTANSSDNFHKSWSMSLRSINCFQQGNNPCSSSLLLGKFLLCLHLELISLERSWKPSNDQNFTCARCKQSYGQCHCRGAYPFKQLTLRSSNARSVWTVGCYHFQYPQNFCL